MHKGNFTFASYLAEFWLVGWIYYLDNICSLKAVGMWQMTANVNDAKTLMHNSTYVQPY